MDDWYHIQLKHVHTNGGRGLLYLYKNSLYKLLMAVYPDYPWKPWLFINTPHKFWKEADIQVTY